MSIGHRERENLPWTIVDSRVSIGHRERVYGAPKNPSALKVVSGEPPFMLEDGSSWKILKRIKLKALMACGTI